MSLNFDLRSVPKGTEFISEDGKWLTPHTEGLIFSTMAVGLGSISEKNLKTFTDRLNMWEFAAKLPLTPARVVEAHIGLKTNVSDESFTVFSKRIMEVLAETIRKAQEKLEEV